jgi:hypothetical protein
MDASAWGLWGRQLDNPTPLIALVAGLTKNQTQFVTAQVPSLPGDMIRIVIAPRY